MLGDVSPEDTTPSEAAEMLYAQLSPEDRWRLMQTIVENDASTLFNSPSGESLGALNQRAETLRLLLSQHTDEQKRQLCAKIGVSSEDPADRPVDLNS
eukprot:5708003-Prymnesium_polylepis.2